MIARLVSSKVAASLVVIALLLPHSASAKDGPILGSGLRLVETVEASVRGGNGQPPRHVAGGSRSYLPVLVGAGIGFVAGALLYKSDWRWRGAAGFSIVGALIGLAVVGHP